MQKSRFGTIFMQKSRFWFLYRYKIAESLHFHTFSRIFNSAILSESGVHEEQLSPIPVNTVRQRLPPDDGTECPYTPDPARTFSRLRV